MMGDKENENNKEIVRYKDSNMLYFCYRYVCPSYYKRGADKGIFICS
jgi:hypothetical protein